MLIHDVYFFRLAHRISSHPAFHDTFKYFRELINKSPCKETAIGLSYDHKWFPNYIGSKFMQKFQNILSKLNSKRVCRGRHALCFKKLVLLLPLSNIKIIVFENIGNLLRIVIKLLRMEKPPWTNSHSGRKNSSIIY